MYVFTEKNTLVLHRTYQLLIPSYMQWLRSNQNLHSTNSRVANRNLFRCRYTIFLISRYITRVLIYPCDSDEEQLITTAMQPNRQVSGFS